MMLKISPCHDPSYLQNKYVLPLHEARIIPTKFLIFLFCMQKFRHHLLIQWRKKGPISS